MEACGSSHYWARELTRIGHEVRLIAPAYIKPYVKRSKSDAAYAETICEAVTRPTMRFVPIKSSEQQAILCQHRTRELLIRQCTPLEAIPGIGTVNASAIVATIGSDEQFSSAQDVTLPPGSG